MKPVEQMTYKELLEAQERYKKTLSNKLLLQKLPDKGKKLIDSNFKIEEKLLGYRTETEGLAQMLSGMLISSNPKVDADEMEWTGKIGSTNSFTQSKSNEQQPSLHDESRDIVDILMTTNQMSKIIIDERDSSSIVEKSGNMQDPCYRRLTEKVEHLKPNHQFKPNGTLLHKQNPSPKQHRSWDENTAATPPQWKHGEGVIPIPIEESLGLQIQTGKKLKDLALQRFKFTPNVPDAVTIHPEEYEEVYDEEPEGAGGGMAILVHEEVAD